MKPTLVILAAGMASRYGSMKQTESFGPSGETIMDYSIYDAIRTGFGKVVFIIRKEFEIGFREIFDSRLKNKIAVEYVFQELENFTEGYVIPKERVKPWGTAHAVLCASEKVGENFAVINADDFYGRDAFEKASRFLTEECGPSKWSIIGYELVNTLSNHGTVNRGVCRLDEEGNLVSIAERLNISRTNGMVHCEDGMEPGELPLDTKVSMNFWCFDPSVFPFSKNLFESFLKSRISEPKSEFFIPIVADKFIKDGTGTVEVIPTSALWFGVTYKEDAPAVRNSINELIAKGEYPASLWNS